MPPSKQNVLKPTFLRAFVGAFGGAFGAFVGLLGRAHVTTC